MPLRRPKPSPALDGPAARARRAGRGAARDVLATPEFVEPVAAPEVVEALAAREAVEALALDEFETGTPGRNESGRPDSASLRDAARSVETGVPGRSESGRPDSASLRDAARSVETGVPGRSESGRPDSASLRDAARSVETGVPGRSESGRPDSASLRDAARSVETGVPGRSESGRPDSASLRDAARSARTRARFDEGARESPAPEGAFDEARVGDPSVDLATFRAMPSLFAVRHVMALLSRRRADVARASRLAEAGELVIALDDPARVARLLEDLTESPRVADLYPLELLAYVLERRADLLPRHIFGGVVLNRLELERVRFAPEDTVRLTVPLAARVRAFALEGGGTPGYCLQPGPPGEYHLTVGEPGTRAFLFLALIRGERRVDRVVLEMTETHFEAGGAGPAARMV